MYLHQQGFKKGTTNYNLYIKDKDNSFLVIVVYVYNIIFGNNDEQMSQRFATTMQQEFEMSLLRDCHSFLVYRFISQKEEFLVLKVNTSKKF